MALSRGKILVIDDDPDFLDLIEMVVGELGVAVRTARSCGEGLRLLREEPTSIVAVLLDYTMPGMDPPACAKAIRQLSQGAIPVVLCTAAMNAAERASELGLTEWLAKPFDLDSLRQLIERVSAQSPPAAPP